jgi:hypothetical protein
MIILKPDVDQLIINDTFTTTDNKQNDNTIGQQVIINKQIREDSLFSLDSSFFSSSSCGIKSGIIVVPPEMSSFSPVNSETVERIEPDDLKREYDSILQQSTITSHEISKKKFLPHRLLVKARSRLFTDESSIGKRTSLLLYKFNTQTFCSLPTVSQRISSKNAGDDNNPLDEIAKQSSKLKIKGKAFSKKLKRKFSLQHQC